MDTYVKDAEGIWADFQKRIRDKKFRGMNVDAQLEFYQKNYNRFTMTFPIVLRYMIQLKSYNKKAFMKFVRRLETNPYKSELEYCERQADYVKYLFMEMSPNHSMKEANATWQQTYDMLAKEVQMFKDAEDAVKNKLEKNNNQNNMEKRKELKLLLENVNV